jgi:hypothetical protein
MGVRPVYSRVSVEPTELAEQIVGAPLQHGGACLQDAEDGKKDS